MAECEWAIFCEHPFRDAQHRLGMIGIFDTLVFDALPQPLRHGWLNLKFRGNPAEEVRFTVRIFSPEAEVTETPEPPVMTVGDSGAVEMSLDLQDLVFERFGNYEIEISVNGQPGLVTTLRVIRGA
jgi:hypothetical protein